MAQKALGKVLYHGKSFLKNPIKKMKHDVFRNRHRSVNPKKVKRGKYTTMFGNKRKVVGYKGKTPYIKKTKGGQALGAAFSVPGFMALEGVAGSRQTSSGKERGVGRRVGRGLLEGLAFKAVPGLAITGLVGHELYKAKKQKRVPEPQGRAAGTALAAGKALGGAGLV